MRARNFSTSFGTLPALAAYCLFMFLLALITHLVVPDFSGEQTPQQITFPWIMLYVLILLGSPFVFWQVMWLALGRQVNVFSFLLGIPAGFAGAALGNLAAPADSFKNSFYSAFVTAVLCLAFFTVVFFNKRSYWKKDIFRTYPAPAGDATFTRWPALILILRIFLYPLMFSFLFSRSEQRYFFLIGLLLIVIIAHLITPYDYRQFFSSPNKHSYPRWWGRILLVAQVAGLAVGILLLILSGGPTSWPILLLFLSFWGWVYLFGRFFGSSAEKLLRSYANQAQEK